MHPAAGAADEGSAEDLPGLQKDFREAKERAHKEEAEKAVTSEAAHRAARKEEIEYVSE